MGELVGPEEGRDQMRRQADRRQGSLSTDAVGKHRSRGSDPDWPPKIHPGER